MSIRIPDKRELKLFVQLSAINMTQVGTATGEYSVYSSLPDPQNTKSLLFDATHNRPKIQYGNPVNNKQEYKTSRGVKAIPNVQNAKMVDMLVNPSASSCTFAYGAIGTDEFHPIYDLLKGPTSAEYSAYNITTPTISRTLTGLTKPSVEGFFDNIENILPTIPFLSLYFAAPTRTVLSFSTTDAKQTSAYITTNFQKSVTSYNIWNLYLTRPNVTNPNDTTRPLYTTVKKYEGPISATATASGNTPSLKTVRDDLNGSRVLVQCKGKGKSCTIKREFPVSKDAIYDQAPKIFFPTRYKFEDTFNGQTTTSYLNALDYETVNTKGSDNSGFHINLQNVDATGNDSVITVLLENATIEDNIVYSVQISLVANSLPKILIKYRKGNLDYFYEYTNVKGPVFDGRASLGYDIFVHFVGPVLMVGFTIDQTQWNSIYPEELNSFAGQIDQNSKGNVEFFFKKDKSFVMINATNATYQMRYSAIMFNNYSFTPTENIEENNVYTTKTPRLPSGANFLGRTTNYQVQKAKNFILMRFNAPSEFSNQITPDTLIGTLARNKYLNAKGASDNVLPQGLISIFGDFRNNVVTASDASFLNSIISGNGIFQYFQIDTLTSNVYDVVQNWGKLFFNGTVEGAAFLSLAPDITPNLKALNFLQSIPNANLSPWVTSCGVNCNVSNTNFSRISKTASIDLKNLDMTTKGIRLLELLEHNVLVVTISAGYGDNQNLETYFQGFITDVSSTRTGSESSISLSCQDFASYALENLYFEENVYFGTLTLKNCIQACINSSGFANYYTIRNEPFIADLALRISANPISGQDSIYASQYDRIAPKLNTFLEKLVRLENQPTFRWEENGGFVLDARYANDNCDTDLKFINYDFENDYINAVASTNNQSKPDWHGLLTGNFSINTNLSNIVSEVQTFGVTTWNGVRFAKTTDAFVQNARSLEAFNSVINSLDPNNTNPVHKGYVGFRKKILDYLDQNELPSQELLALKHSQNEKIAERPFHSISFNCYVTKPLKFHGTFVVNAFVNGEVSVTDKYIYQSLSYTFDKSNNSIIANIQGQAQPWTIKELEIRQGAIIKEFI